MVEPPSSLCTDSRSCEIVVVVGSMSGSVIARVGFREDLRVKDMVGVVRVAPGG
jgi:hypothetical protein